MHLIRSPYAFARIISIDYTKALKYKGVVAILSNSTIKSMKINPMYPGFKVKNKDGTEMIDTHRDILAEKKVRYVGDPVLAIIAETNEIALEASDFINIEYEELSSTTHLNDAIKNNSPVVREELSNNICFDWELGNMIKTNDALNSSKYTTTIDLINNRLVPNPMECEVLLVI